MLILRPTQVRPARTLVRQAVVAVMLAAILTGCGKRGSIAVMPPGPQVGGAIVHTIVATSRAPAPAPEYFSARRSFQTQFAMFDVSVPRDRKQGQVQYPRKYPDPSREFVVTDARRLEGGRAFVAAVNAAAAKFPATQRTGTFFVHGFNNNFAEALYKDVQLRYDLKAPGVGVLFSWSSQAKTLAYAADRENALFARDTMADALRYMGRTNLNGFNLIAHSMGAFVTMETLRTLALNGDREALEKIKAVVLISADLEIDLFRRQAPPVLAAGIPIYLIVSDKDRALKISAALRGEQDRVGSVRSVKELGGLDVAVIDLSDIKSDDFLGHMKVASSPEVINYIRKLRASGTAIFEEDQKTGLFDQGATVLQGATGIILRPLGG